MPVFFGRVDRTRASPSLTFRTGHENFSCRYAGAFDADIRWEFNGVILQDTPDPIDREEHGLWSPNWTLQQVDDARGISVLPVPGERCLGFSVAFSCVRSGLAVVCNDRRSKHREPLAAGVLAPDCFSRVMLCI